MKFAALDCWKSVAELLPESARLENFNFSDGRKLSLAGTSPKTQVQESLVFSANLRKARAGDHPLFGLGGDAFDYRDAAGAGGNDASWTFSLELARTTDK